MTVRELIIELEKCDPNLDVNTKNVNSDDPTNYWVNSVEQHETGRSGYEENGEVILNTSE